jgi:nicotinamide mononucleotide adenylyltransferase
MTKWNNRAPTVQLLGRYQPWHGGHTELFKRAHSKTGQVIIMVRDTGGTDEKNPFDYEFVKERIIKDLEESGFKFNKDFIVELVPNIVNITYGRDVGYMIEKEDFDKEILKISATQIRKEMGL